MEPLARLPVFYALEGKRVLLVGGTDAAAWKAELLASTGALLDVVADEPSETLRAVAADPPAGRITLHERAWQPSDLDGVAIAVGAFEDEAEGPSFAAAARQAGVPVNVVDRPAFCDFAFGAVVNRSPLVIGISTDGAAPNLAQMLRGKIEALAPRGIKRWAEAAKAWRPAIQAASASFDARRRIWERFSALAFQRPNEPPTDADLRDLLSYAPDADAQARRGEVLLVGAGPGDADLLTVKAVRALQSADVILYDALVSAEVLEFARREAKTMLVGKTGYGPSCKQDDINALMVGLAGQGKRVVRLKSGDPGIFGRAGEEIEACRAAGIPVQIVPGVSAAQAAAASVGVSLTHRDHAQRLQFVTAHGRDGGVPTGLDLQALADPRATTCIYMGRKTIPVLAKGLIEKGLPPTTVAVCVSRASQPEERRERTTVQGLADGLPFLETSAPTLVMIGDALGAAAELAQAAEGQPAEKASSGQR
jgi:uroporphyrin-III C-methyltransferase/precorrin-2 dehydrogenase/sirohydrochlorin ferrochelatase